MRLVRSRDHILLRSARYIALSYKGAIRVRNNY